MLDNELFTLIFWVALGMVCVGLTVRFFMKPQMLRRLVNKQAGELIESELRFKILFDKAPIGIAELDTQSGAFIRVNPKLSEEIKQSMVGKGTTFNIYFKTVAQVLAS